jgi:hypothetical protein
VKGEVTPNVQICIRVCEGRVDVRRGQGLALRVFQNLDPKPTSSGIVYCMGPLGKGRAGGTLLGPAEDFFWGVGNLIAAAESLVACEY